MTANRPMDTIRDKSKVNGSWEPKGRGNKSNGPTWQEKEQQKLKPNELDEQELLPRQCPGPQKDKRRQYKPKSLRSSHHGDKHEPRTRCRMRQGKNGRNGMGVKEDKHRRQWNLHELKHHLLVPSQYRRGEPSAKGFRGYGLVVGRKRGLFWGSWRGFFWGKCLVGMAFRSKETRKWLRPLDACH